MPFTRRRHTARHPVAVALAVALLLLGACGRGEDRPGQVTTDTPSRGSGSSSRAPASGAG